jgi:hypothetical protein
LQAPCLVRSCTWLLKKSVMPGATPKSSPRTSQATLGMKMSPNGTYPSCRFRKRPKNCSITTIRRKLTSCLQNPGKRKTVCSHRIDIWRCIIFVISGPQWGLDVVFTLLVEEHAKALVDALPEKQDEPAILLAFDECTQLDERGSQEKYRRYKYRLSSDRLTLVAFKRMLRACEDYNIWFALIDSDSRVADMQIPVNPHVPFGPLRSSPTPLPPWSYLPADIFVDPDDRPKTPKEALSLEHLRRYGRPVCIFAFPVYAQR